MLRSPCTVQAVALLLALAGWSPSPAKAQTPVGTAITYEGQLKSGGSPANGNFDMTFTLFDAATAGNQTGPTLTFDSAGANPVAVTNGLFAVVLDFGVSPYTANQARWLEIAVNGQVLSPRQVLTPTPFAINTRGLNVDASGNVGIGTASPTHLVEVYSSDFQGPFLGLRNLYYGISSYSISVNNNYYGYGSARNFEIRDEHDPANIRTRFIIDGDGSVGIGTTAPQERLTVAGSAEIGTSNADYQHLRIGGGNSSGYLYGAYYHLGDGIHMGYNYYVDGGFAPLIPHPDGQTSRISMGYGYVALATGGTGAEPVDRLHVDPFGNVGINQTLPAYRLDVNGTIRATGGCLGCSDARFKTHITPLCNALETVSKLEGVNFDWKCDEFPDHGFGDGRQVGLIAQEVREVAPEVVSEGGDGYLSIDYGRLTPILIEAVKELKASSTEAVKQVKREKDAQAAEQQRAIAALRSENGELKARLAKLESAMASLTSEKTVRAQ